MSGRGPQVRGIWPFTGQASSAGGALLPQWRALLETFPDRFMIGSDPVWPVENLDSWDQADTG